MCESLFHLKFETTTWLITNNHCWEKSTLEKVERGKTTNKSLATKLDPNQSNTMEVRFAHLKALVTNMVA